MTDWVLTTDVNASDMNDDGSMVRLRRGDTVVDILGKVTVDIAIALTEHRRLGAGNTIGGARR